MTNPDEIVAEALRVINGDEQGRDEPNQESIASKPRNLLHGSIVGDPKRRALRVEADFVTCTQ